MLDFVNHPLKVVMFSVLLILFLLAVYYFFPEKKLPKDVEIDRLILYKSKRELRVYSGERFLKSYSVALGQYPIGKKEFEGDKKTPEGTYYIDAKNPNSSFYKNLGISYPNDTDTTYAAQFGKSAGSLIKIHGIRNGMSYLGKFHRWNDWTAGCMAVTNSEMEELFEAVKIGSVIEMKP